MPVQESEPTLITAGALCQFALRARDGEMGRVHDLYYDDVTWHIDGVVANIGAWPVARLVLIAPDVIESVDMESQHLAASLSRQELEASAPVELEPPPSLHREAELHAHHDWPVYWTAGNPMVSSVLPGTEPDGEPSGKANTTGKVNAYATREVTGYRLRGVDGDLGLVNDFVVGWPTWDIRQLVADVGTWLPARQVLLPVTAIREVRRDELTIAVDLKQADLESCPDAPAGTQPAAGPSG